MKYWVDRRGNKYQSGPYGEPPIDAFVDEQGFGKEFTEEEVERIVEELKEKN